MFAINAVARLSSVCILYVTFVRPTQPVKIFGNLSTPFGWYLSHPLTSTDLTKNFTESKIVPAGLGREPKALATPSSGWGGG